MNPRHRRLLIPGLLLALIVIVVVASLVNRADAASDAPAVVLSDSRIVESSGLAVSTTHDDLAYTVNDSGHATEVFAVDLTSGEVVGVTTLAANLRDVEALALRDGTLWIGDLGDNSARRDDVALVAIDEPGRATRTVEGTRYPVALAGGPVDVEALLAPPGSDRLQVVTKSLGDATVMTLDEDDLDPRRTTEFEATAAGLPALVTDGGFSPDGNRVALLSYGSLWVVDPADWSILGSRSLPALEQSETVSFVENDEVLVGSEGADSPLYRLDLPADLAVEPGAPATVAVTSPATSEAARTPSPATDGTGAPVDSRTVVLSGIGVVGTVALIGWAALRRARSGGSRRAIR